MSAFDFPRPPAWTESAVCASVDPQIFHPEKGGSVRAAKRVCAACPVAAECLAYALDHDDRHGIYGGVTAFERRAMTRRAA